MPFRDLPRPAKLLVIGGCLAGAATFIWWPVLLPAADSVSAIVYLLLAFVVASRRVRLLQGGATMSLGFVFVFAALFSCGTRAAMAAAVLNALGSHALIPRERARPRLWQTAYNAASLTIAALGTGIAYTSLRPALGGEQDLGPVLLAAAVAVTLYYAITVITIGSASTLTQRRLPPKRWWHELLGMAPAYYAGGAAALAMDAAVRYLDYWVFIVGLPFAYLIHWAFTAQADRLSQEVERLRERVRAEEAQRLVAIGELAAGVAHEFNNILAGIRGRADLAQAMGTPEQYEKLVQTVQVATGRGAKICRNLLGFARPQDPQRTPIRIEEPVQMALAMAARELENSEIEVAQNYDTEGKWVHADTGQLEQVFLNLAINACHAMRQGGRLAIDASYVPEANGPGEVVVTVSDTGIGIRPGDLPRIFDPFFSTKRPGSGDQVGGTGLGLSVSQGIVNAHGGSLTVRSEVGVGTTFELRLAAHDEPIEEERHPRRVADSGPAEGAGRRVLLVEDEEAIRETIGEALKWKGYDVVMAGTASEAAGALGSTSFDVVVSDMLLPGGGGREVLRTTRELPDPPPVVLITGMSEEGLANELLKLGADACLQKPFGMFDFLQTLRTLLQDEDGES